MTETTRPARSRCVFLNCTERPTLRSGGLDDGLCKRHRFDLRHGKPLSFPANPWTGRVACPACGDDARTLPYDPAEPLWHCTWAHCGAWFNVGPDLPPRGQPRPQPTGK